MRKTLDEFRLNTFLTVAMLMVLIVLHNYSPVAVKLGILYLSLFYTLYLNHIESLIDAGYFDREARLQTNTGRKVMNQITKNRLRDEAKKTLIYRHERIMERVDHLLNSGAVDEGDTDTYNAKILTESAIESTSPTNNVQLRRDINNLNRF